MTTNLMLTDDVVLTDKEAMGRLLAEADSRSGFIYNPLATAQQAREMMKAQGIRTEDNLFSRDIIRSRYPDDFDEED